MSDDIFTGGWTLSDFRKCLLFNMGWNSYVTRDEKMNKSIVDIGNSWP